MINLSSNNLFLPYNRKQRLYNNSTTKYGYGQHSVIVSAHKIKLLNIQNIKCNSQLWMYSALCALSSIFTGKNGLSIDFYKNSSDVNSCHLECHLNLAFSEFAKYFNEQIIKEKNNIEIIKNKKHKTIFLSNTTDEIILSEIIQNYDLCFQVASISKSDIVKIWYNRSFYTKTYIKDTMTFYNKMFIWLAEHPDEPMKNFPGYGPTLKGPHMYIPKMQLRDAINSTCDQYPEKIASEDENGVICYRDLKMESDAIACWLIHNGVVEQTTIGLWMNKTNDYLIFLVAAIKVGCICLSLDIRISNQVAMKISKQSNLNILIVDEPHLCDDNFRTYTIKDIKRETAAYINMNPVEVFTDSQPYFLFFTSGSAGESKGIMLDENGVKNHLYTKINLLKLCPSDIIAHNISISFIASLWLFLAPLIMGSKVVLISETVSLNVRLEKYLFYKITILTSVPSTLRTLLKINSKESILKKVNAFRWIVSTGEELDSGLVCDLFSNFPKIKIMNAYGQTECSDDTLHYIIERPIHSGFVPIGTPSLNTDVCIRDRYGIVLPHGAVGEITITGPGVAKKYLYENSSLLELIPKDGDIYGTYLSGDAGYINKSDQVVYIGRIHSDEKVNGNKISTQQIQFILKKNRMVQDAAVYVYEDDNGFKQTILYYVSNEDINIEKLKKHLNESLYWYMIPDHFIKVSSLPRNINGKIDFPFLFEQNKGKMDDSYNALLQLLSHYDEDGNNDFIMTGGSSLAFAILAAKMTQSNQALNQIANKINQQKKTENDRGKHGN